MNVLITGGAGFIGYHLAKYHHDLGDSVTIFDNFFKSSGDTDIEFEGLIQQERIQFCKVNLNEPIPADIEAPRSFDFIYHLAAINGTRLFYEMPYEVAVTNLSVTINLLKWLENVSFKRLVYSSTSEVYADSNTVGLLNIPTSEKVPVVFTQPTNTRFSYATSKFMGEFLCNHFGSSFNKEVSVIRYHNIYGPRMGSKHVIPEFILRFLNKDDPFFIYGGKETRAFCYIDDATKATMLVATTEECNGEIIHIGNSQEEISIIDLAQKMKDQFESSVDFQLLEGKSASVKRRCPDTSKIHKLTGYGPSVNLKEGLLDTTKWYKDNHIF